MAPGISLGKEMVTSSFTFVAMPEAITLVGAKPPFVDVPAAAHDIGATHEGGESGNLSTVGVPALFPSKAAEFGGDGRAILASGDALGQA